MSEVQTTVFLRQHETKALLDLGARGAGTTRIKMMVLGNALLSSVFVKSATPGATLKVNYFDTTTGDVDTPERYDLTSHALLGAADAGQTVRLLVPRIHNKPYMEAIVTGGTVEFGVYASIVADFPVDLQGALDGQIANLGTDDGIPIAVYDPSDGKFYLLRGAAGVLATDPDARGAGSVYEATVAVSPGPEAAVLTTVVPVGETWRIRYAKVACRGQGRWSLKLDGARIGGGVTGPARNESRDELPPAMVATAGQTIEVLYAYTHGPSSIDLDAFVGVTVL